MIQCGGKLGGNHQGSTSGSSYSAKLSTTLFLKKHSLRLGKPQCLLYFVQSWFNSTQVNYQECGKNLHYIDEPAISMSLIHPTGREALPFNGQVIVFRCIYSKHGSIVQVAKYQPFAKFSIIQLFFSCGPLTSRISCQTEKQISGAISFVLYSVVHFLFRFHSATL